MYTYLCACTTDLNGVSEGLTILSGISHVRGHLVLALVHQRPEQLVILGLHLQFQLFRPVLVLFLFLTVSTRVVVVG